MNNFRYRAIGLAGAAVVACLTASPSHAGSSWLSTVTIEGAGLDDAGIGVTSSSGFAEAEAGDRSTAVFDITVSLEENPAGDSTYPDDAGGADDEQNRFEAKIEEFADAVFQMTNGRHKIGTVTMFRDGIQSDKADVNWKANCPPRKGPRANASGFGVAGSQIYFCTNWSGSSIMDTPKGAGFTLAHEWGHYAYGVYDEYTATGPCTGTASRCAAKSRPRQTDTASAPSIMTNQWRAARDGGDQDWLEFSTEGVEPYRTDPVGGGRNAHARVFGESGWATLTRDPRTDPKESFLPSRTRYTNLVAPTAADLTVNDDESTARSALDIVWAGDQVVELMLDTSGSMSGALIDNARTAARLLVGQLTPGESAVGVGRFSGSATQVFPITDVPDPDTGVRAGAQAAIGTFSASGGTDIERAALTALAQVTGFQGGNRPSVVFLLTDGQSSVDVARVVRQYTAARVALITFGFGPNVDAALLQALADGTGGQYFFSPTDLSQIQRAFVAADAAFSSRSIVASATSASVAGSTEFRPVQLDSTLASVSISATYALPESDVSLRLLDASGNDTGQAFACTASSSVSCEIEVDVQALGGGEYSVEVTNGSVLDKNVSLLVFGSPAVFERYGIAVDLDDAAYPSNLAVRATVTKGEPLSGLDVTATVTTPDGTLVDLALLDDGGNSDPTAGDGVYAADVPYDRDGTYTVLVRASNAAGNARTTTAGLAVSVREDGSGYEPESLPVPENFTRVAVTSAAVTGFRSDDHDDVASAPAGCTVIADDNIDTVGRIDRAGDVDCFRFTPSVATRALAVRATSLRADIMPVVRVYDAAGTTELLAANLATSRNPESGVIIDLPAASSSAAGHVVTVAHADTATATGGYAVSVGPRLTSDDGRDPPPAVVLVSPTVSGPTRPTFTWEASPGATWYLLWVDNEETAGDNSQRLYARWYSAGQGGCAGGGTCTIDTPFDFGGDISWWVRPWNPSGGAGSWGSPLSYSTGATPNPSMPTQVGPSGVGAGAMPEFSWRAVTDASWYHLWVEDAGTGSQPVVARWYSAESADCFSGDDLCRVTSPVALSGASNWWVSAYRADGATRLYGTWAGPLSFVP